MHLNRQALLLPGLWLILRMVPAGAQIQFPGKPMDGTGRLKAADVMYVLPPADPFEIEAGMARNREGYKKPLQFAIERAVDLTPESNGAWTETAGYRVWRVHIVSPLAYSLGLVFNEYRLEPGVKVFLYDPDRMHIRGAYTSGNNKSSGILAVGHTPGEELVVEMQVPAEMEDYGALRIESVSHAFLDLEHLSGAAECSPGEFGCSQACEVDVNCTEGDGWQLTRRSVVRILTTTQYCTGVLVNNTAYDGTPYVLTAEHCINNENVANNTVFQFNYESPSCNGPDGPLTMSLSGSDHLAAGDSIDFSLVRLSVSPPESYDVYYAGWDRSFSQSAGTWAIHHPWGDVKKISHDIEIPSVPVYPGDVPYNDLDDYYYFSYWWIRKWDMGSTEGGSSGSPLFNSDQRVIGTLSGGYARCGDSIGFDPETQRVIYNPVFNIDDYFTQIKYAWDFYGTTGSTLKPWLDPLNTGAIRIGGYHPTGIDLPEMGPTRYFTLYPNPVSDLLRITSDLPGSHKVDYRLMDLAGSTRMEGVLDGARNTELNILSLGPGVYLIQLASPGVQEIHKIIVTR